MTRVKLSQQVMIDETNEITTPAELLDSRRAYVEMVEHFYNRTKPAYFVTLYSDRTDGVKSGWEISEFAYYARCEKQSHPKNRIEPATKVEKELPVKTFEFRGHSIEIKTRLTPDFWNNQVYTADVYDSGKLIIAGDYIDYDPALAIHASELDFYDYASDAYTS